MWFALVLASIMLPPQVTLIPLYVLFQQLGWLDTFLPLIVPAWFGGGALSIFLMRQFFLQIPTSWMRRRSSTAPATSPSGGESTCRCQSRSW